MIGTRKADPAVATLTHLAAPTHLHQDARSLWGGEGHVVDEMGDVPEEAGRRAHQSPPCSPI